MDTIALPGHGQDVVRAGSFGLEHWERSAAEDVNAHQLGLITPLVDDPLRRLHPQDHAERRIAAALAAGGVVASKNPEYTILADQDGDQACVSTSLPPAD
jgi:hypothetical protein